MIRGDWEGESYDLSRGPVDESAEKQPRKPDMRYVATLRQHGSRVSGTMEMTATFNDLALYKHLYKGYVKNSFFVYDMSSTEPEQFRLSTAMLHISNSGDVMQGYFLANAGRGQAKSPAPTYTGYTVMRRKGIGVRRGGEAAN
jgi:hypothetical protein